MIEHIHKDVCNFDYNKYGECINTSRYSIDFDVEYEKLNPMCRDLLKIIKDKDCFRFYIICPRESMFTCEIRRCNFDMEYIKKITFKDYYLTIDGFKVFYNAIMNFGKLNNWR